MRKLMCLLSAFAMAATLLCTNALAWDNCGHGMHRNYAGYCVSNYGRSSGCRTATISAGTFTPASLIADTRRCAFRQSQLGRANGSGRNWPARSRSRDIRERRSR
jgi:hypothetical protein